MPATNQPKPHLPTYPQWQRAPTMTHHTESFCHGASLKYVTGSGHLRFLVALVLGVHYLLTMTDTSSQTINSTDDKISALTALVETIAKGQKAMTDGLNKFSTAVVETLSGQTAAAPAPTVAAPAAIEGKRRGRPVGSRNKPKADAVPAVPAKPRELTADEKYAVDLVKRAGRMTQTELADTLKVERSLVQLRMKEPLKRGLVVAQVVEPPTGHRHILYRRADWVSFKGE